MEIVFLYILCTDIGRMVRRNGRKPLGFQALLITLWLAGEVLGAVIGTMTLGVSVLTYFIALGGAVLGAVIAFRIAKSAAPEPLPSRFPVALVQSFPSGNDRMAY
ncbi:MAG TPA: hypothetical protein VGI81_15455 [Tepidisphaeraceae bacterium]|jgi:hypothetical protein